MREKIIVVDGVETNYVVRDDGTIGNTKANHEVFGTYERNEYRSIQIVVEGKRKSIMVHRLVAEAFCDNPNNYTIVHHIDGDRNNNKAENLEWVTAKKNSQEAIRKRPYVARKNTQEIELEDNWRQLTEIDANQYISRDGRLWNKRFKNIKGGTVRNGYIRYTIGKKCYSAHILVWEAFNGKIPKGYFIDHIDGNRSNNNLDNLRLVTQSENMKNAMKNGHACQVIIQQFTLLGELVQEFCSIRAAAEYLGVNEGSLRKIANESRQYGGYIWKRKENNN